MHTSIYHISMGYKRNSGKCAGGKAGMQSRWGGDAAADDDAPEDSVAVTAIAAGSAAAAELIDAGAGAHHAGSSR